MANYLIGRQQIFDRDLKVFGYELLFRGDDSLNLNDEAEAYLATNELIVDALLEHGLQQLVGPHLAFINFSTINLIDRTALLLPKDKVVIELVENIIVDQEVIAAVEELAQAGYSISLDNFTLTPETFPLIQFASIIKINVHEKSAEEVMRVIGQLKSYPVKLLAGKIETYAEYDCLRALGCHYFQGFFFSKPKSVPGKRVDIVQNSGVQLLALIHKADIDSKELAEVISRDVGLSYKLLRYVNSAYFGLQRSIDSISQAILFLGMGPIKTWATILMLSNFSNSSSELLTISLMRAKTCETLAMLAGAKNPDLFFLVGLLSTLDCLLDKPMERALKALPLSEEIKTALLSKTNLPGEALQCAIDYEEWKTTQIHFQNLQPQDIRQAFLDSLKWTNDISQQIGHV